MSAINGHTRLLIFEVTDQLHAMLYLFTKLMVDILFVLDFHAPKSTKRTG